MKKNIIIIAYGGNSWIGGLYYKKNIVYSILQSEKICSKFNIVVCTTKDCKDIFNVFDNSIKVCVLPKKKTIFYFIIMLLMIMPQNKYFYSFTSVKYSWQLNKKSIFWIPDFQYKYYPTFFSEEEITYRNNNYNKIAQYQGKLILSSKSCQDDYLMSFPNNKSNVVVVPFVSYIEKEICSINEHKETETLSKYSLSKGKYIYIPNQFWKHKNHIVVIEAINTIIEKNKDFDFSFVFTGALEDYRNPEYIEQLKKSLEDEKIKKYVNNLNFVSRDEQLIIMKNALFIIQPSLFEGWGTVLEDAKVFDKRVLLSDIPVHEEQQYEKCILFDPQDSDQLANLIIENVSFPLEDDINKGITRMQKDAMKYSEKLEIIFE